MFRALIVFLLIGVTGPDLFSQIIQAGPIFKNGHIAADNSLLSRKINHHLWQSAFSGSHYYVVIQLNDHADQHAKQQLLDRGIRLKQWISGNNWLATCRLGFNNRNLSELGIRNIYSIPSSLKLNNELLEYSANLKGTKDLIAVNCFSDDNHLIVEGLKESGAKIMETKIKPANTWFIQGSPETIRKLSALPFVSSM